MALPKEQSEPWQFFRRITGDGEAAAVKRIEALVHADEKTFEGQFLEFKGGNVHNIQEVWSRALSAFSNSDGGVVIWGVQTKKDKGVEHAHSLNKVHDPLLHASELEKRLQHATDPLVRGVEIFAVPSTGGEGFVVCFIPESDYKPHRAMNDSASFRL